MKTIGLEIIRRLAEWGAEGIIAGCTEIELLLTSDDAGLPYFPTTRLHAQDAVDLALADHAGLPVRRYGLSLSWHPVTSTGSG